MRVVSSLPKVVLAALILSFSLISGCSGQTSKTPVETTSSSAEAAVEQEMPSAKPSAPPSSNARSLTPEQRAMLGTDEQVALISKSWRPFAVLYGGDVYSFSEYPTFADLYDTTYITIYDNGRFAYQMNALYIYRGNWQFYEDYDGVYTYVLRTDSVSKISLESGMGGEEIGSGDGKMFVVYIFGDRPFLAVTENGTSIDEDVTPAFIASDEWQVPMEPSKTSENVSDGAAESENPKDSAPSQQDANTSAPSVSAPSSPGHSVTTGERSAAEKALSYLSYMAFSRDGLIEQLEFEGYSHSEAVYGADHSGADWNEQAALKALEYLRTTPFSRAGLIDQLEFEGFTSEQAEYGVSRCGADWNEQAVKKARQYLELMSMSHSQLVDQLEFEGFTHSEAVYGAENA